MKLKRFVSSFRSPKCLYKVHTAHKNLSIVERFLFFDTERDLSILHAITECRIIIPSSFKTGAYMETIYDVRQQAQMLVENSFVCVPYESVALMEQVQEHFVGICESYSPEMLSKLCLVIEERPDGKRDPDDGFIFSRKGEGLSKDTKCRFHYRPTFLKHIEAMLQCVPQGLQRDLQYLCALSKEAFVAHQTTSDQVMLAIAKVCPSLETVMHDYFRSKSVRVPTSRPLLRLLDYPPKGEEKAEVHFDRNFVSFHAGDKGGELFLRRKDGTEEPISPCEGQAVIFWGYKAEMASKRSSTPLKALAHGSKGKEGERRRAIVSFMHTGIELWDAPPVTY